MWGANLPVEDKRIHFPWFVARVNWRPKTPQETRSKLRQENIIEFRYEEFFYFAVLVFVGLLVDRYLILCRKRICDCVKTSIFHKKNVHLRSIAGCRGAQSVPSKLLPRSIRGSSTALGGIVFLG